MAGRPAVVLEGILYAGVLLLPLVCLAGLERPFSTPKTWLLILLAAAVGAHYALRRQQAALNRADYAWLAWVLAVSISALSAAWASFDALLLTLLPVPLYLPLREGRLSADRVARMIVWGSAALSFVACMQYAGLDPMRVAGWQPEHFANPRMRVYGTLGNPAFVAAWLCATLPLVVAAAGRRARWAALALQLGAIFATGSRVFLLALPAAAAVALLRRARHKAWWLAGVPVAAALLWLSPARPLTETIEGRLYYARVTASHWREIPVFGFGPGSFRPQFAQWQVAWLKERGSGGAAARFAGDVDHAHNDYVEMLVESGPAGLGIFIAFCAWTITASWRAHRAGPLVDGAMGGIAALMFVALVDFPFHRPAEWALFWLLLALSAGTSPEPDRTQMKEEVCRSYVNG